MSLEGRLQFSNEEWSVKNKSIHLEQVDVHVGVDFLAAKDLCVSLSNLATSSKVNTFKPSFDQACAFVNWYARHRKVACIKAS